MIADFIDELQLWYSTSLERVHEIVPEGLEGDRHLGTDYGDTLSMCFVKI